MRRARMWPMTRARSCDVERGPVADSPVEPAAARSWLDPVTFELFRRLSASRGRRIFHPSGAAYAACFAANDQEGSVTAGIFFPGFEHEALVPLSRGLGLRRGAPGGFWGGGWLPPRL